MEGAEPSFCWLCGWSSCILGIGGIFGFIVLLGFLNGKASGLELLIPLVPVVALVTMFARMVRGRGVGGALLISAGHLPPLIVGVAIYLTGSWRLVDWWYRHVAFPMVDKAIVLGILFDFLPLVVAFIAVIWYYLAGVSKLRKWLGLQLPSPRIKLPAA